MPHFGITESAKVVPLGNGHINDTFLVRWPAGEMVLQRINTQVFKLPNVLVNNAQTIAQHLNSKLQSGDYQLKVVEPVLTQDQALFVELDDGGFWRAINYLPHSHSIEVVSDEQQAESAAKAFGHFSCALSDLDAQAIEDVIPQFHHLPGRIEQLKAAVEQDVVGRLGQCQSWVDMALSQSGLLQELARVSDQLPLRICHNDTKINNMLYDKRDMTSLAIIDLDTCMKGHLMYDFGDMVRTFTSPEEEDSTHLDKVNVRESIFAAICRGYLSELGHVLSEQEKQSLWLGARVICLMIGVRFLTDYLNGDVYFHVHRDNHNLERAANQFTLYQSLLSQQDTLKQHLQ
nr:aminoglycoside phosphotransferase family protein [Shewanella sp. Isolate11]